MLLEAMADDLNEPQDALRPRLVAAAAVAALTSASTRRPGSAPAAKGEALAVLDDALLLLRGGLDALQDQ